MKKILLLLVLACGCMAGFAQTTYYWVGGLGPTSFTANANWNTLQNGTGAARTGSALATDILIFNGSNVGGATTTTGSVTCTATSTTMGQLILQNNATLTIVRPTGGGGTGTLTLTGNLPGDDFTIDATSTLNLNSILADGSISLTMAATATGSISGNINVSNTGQNRIATGATGALVFNSGANFTCNLTASGAYPLGSVTQSQPNGSVFLSGANLIYNGGTSPMGNSSTIAIVDMRPGSNYYHRANNGTGTFTNNKLFGNIFVEGGATLTCDGPVYRIGNLTINAGCSFITHNSGQTSLLGDLIVNGTYTVPATLGNVLVFGGPAESISGTGTFNAQAIVVGDNSTVILNRSIDVGTSLNVYGKMNFNTFHVTGAGTFNSRAAGTAPSAAGSLVSGSYQISGIPTLTLSGINGLTITGTGIPLNTTVVGFSSSAGTINLSQPITASGNNITLNFVSDTATLVTSSPGGMDATNGSVNVTGGSTFQAGTNYIINAATTTPFGTTTGSAATVIGAGFVDINAAVTTNYSVDIYEHLGINAKFTLRPLDNLHMVANAVVTGTFNNSKYIATLSDAVSGNRSQIQYDNIGAVATVIPVGSSANYLPVTLTPASASAFTIAVFEGITTNGLPNGTQLTAIQKQKVVNAVWAIERNAGIGPVNLRLGWQPAVEGSTFASLPDTDIGIIYNNGTSYSLPLGTGDNTNNNAAAAITTFGNYSVGSVPSTTPFTFAAFAAPKIYGVADFDPGASSLNTTQPIIYTSSNPAVATIIANQVHITGVGTTDITASQASDGFYPAATITRTLTVNKATLTITANNLSKFANQVNPTLTFTYTGFVYGETAAVLTSPVVITTTATTTSPVGSYPITVSGATAVNYNIVFVNGTLMVQPQTAQTITFATLPVKVYGNADFIIVATSTNNSIPITFASSNTAVATVTGSTVHIVGAGTTNITASQAGNIGFTPAADVVRALTVNKVPLTIKVRDTSKLYLTPNPPFTVTYSGFVLGETAANLLTPLVVSTTALDNSAPGNYPITLTGGASNNYQITYTNGTLTIQPEQGTTLQSINVFQSTGSNLTVRIFSPSPKLADVTLWNMLGQPMTRKNIFMPVGFINADIYVGNLPADTYLITVKGNGVDLKRLITITRH